MSPYRPFRSFSRLLRQARLALLLATGLPAAVVTYDLNSLDLITPASSATDGIDGNSAIGVWFNMQSGEAYVVPTSAGIVGKTDLADGRYQLRWNTAFTPNASQVLVQGSLPLNSVRGTTTVINGQVVGQVIRYAENQVINSTGWSNAQYVDLAGTFGVWNAKGRGILPLRFRGSGNSYRYGYADITILPDYRIRLNGIAYEATANTAITPVFIGALAPSPATALAVTGVTGTTAGLSWTDNSTTETGFKIDRRLSTEATFTTVFTTAPNVTTYLDQGLAPATAYVYRVVATTGRDAAPTAEVPATTLVVSNPPATPTNLVAAPSTPTSIRLTWTDNANDEVGVKIERAPVSGAFTALATTGPGITSYFDIDLIPGTIYRYRVTATNGLDSAASNEASAAPFTLAETIGQAAANLAYPTITGTGQTIGLWDFGTALATHAEFGGRVTNVNTTAAVDNHTTHAAGIAVAGGTDPAARGVAPAAALKVHDSTADEAEMRALGMQYPGQAGRIQAASASYGPIRGWNPTTSGTSWVFNAARVGGVAQSVDSSFGAYGSFSRDADQTAALTPYLLVARSAGNDRDDAPSPGQFVYLAPEDFTANTAVLFNAATHPLIDGGTNGGFSSLADAAAAKNVITVGAVNGVNRVAATGALVGTPGATSFSGWGPTNDGRIKPDLVALGVNVRSSGSASTSTYAVITGTSQAAPQVSAAAALLGQAWSASGQERYLRASTLKALLLHTADDLETPGPDPKTGWGLLNLRAALDQLQSHITAPAAGNLREGRLATGQTSASYLAEVPAGGALRVTLAWTDPEAAVPANPAATASLLTRDLDLVVTGPTGTVYRPYVLPYALNTSAGRGGAATTGINRVDPVEQVRLTGLPAGTYRIEVSTASSLSTGPQYFGLVATGGTAPAANGPVPTLVRATGETGVAEILGGDFQLGATVVLTGPGGVVVNATGVEVTSNHIRFRHSPAPLANGSWKVAVTNPDGRTAFARWAVGAGTAAGYDGWLDALYTDAELATPGLAGPRADADGDGVPLLAAYAFGAAAGRVPAASLPVVGTSALGGGATALKLTYSRRIGATDVAIVAENAAAVTGPWNALPAGQYGAPIALGGGVEQVTVTDTANLATAGQRYLRLRVDRL